MLTSTQAKKASFMMTNVAEIDKHISILIAFRQAIKQYANCLSPRTPMTMLQVAERSDSSYRANNSGCLSRRMNENKVHNIAPPAPTVIAYLEKHEVHLESTEFCHE